MKHSVLLVTIIFAQFFPLFSWSEETIKIWQSNSAEQNVFKKISEPFFKATGIRIVNARDGGDKSANVTTYFRDLLAGKVDASTNSGAFDESLKVFRKDAPDVTDAEAKQIIYRIIGRDIFNTFCNLGTGTSELSLAEVMGIFTGKIANWKNVGGKDLPITVVYTSHRTTTNNAFKRAVLNGAELGGKLVDTADYKELLAAVETTPGAIGYGPTELKSDRVTLLKTPPIGRPITMFTKGKPSEKVLKLYDFIANETRKNGLLGN